jgi:peptide/nickel transport system substrate-binding protein
MRWRAVLYLICGLIVDLGTPPAHAAGNVLRYANQSALLSLDPHVLDETTTIAHLAHVYEGLIRRGKNMEIEPALAERWDVDAEARRWRFYLRRGVRFHDGKPFTADDVLFSAERIKAPTSNFKNRLPNGTEVVKLDDHTVEFRLPAPNPVLHEAWHSWFIMSRGWTTERGASEPARLDVPGGASLVANGTGPFRVVDHRPNQITILSRHLDWWDRPEHNLDEVHVFPIASPATRVAALLSGEVDLIDPLPVQDVDRVRSHPGLAVATRPETRVIFLGFDQSREELLHASVKGRNPFKDVRVREAFYRAIDVEAIRSRVMGGLSRPTALLVAPEAFALAYLFERPRHDGAAARRLLSEAGYADGFRVDLDCPSDRYLNDHEICQAVSVMLAKIGIEVTVVAQPRARFFAKVMERGGYDTSFYLLGWNAVDPYPALEQVYGCRRPGSLRGSVNLGGYCNAEVEDLIGRILVETDVPRRNELIRAAFARTTADFAYIPLHQQPIVWGHTQRVRLHQRADNSVLLFWARKQ